MRYSVQKKLVEQVIRLLYVANIGAFSNVSGKEFFELLHQLNVAFDKSDDDGMATLMQETIDTLANIISSRNGEALFVTDKKNKALSKLTISDIAKIIEQLYAEPVRTLKI